MADDFKYRAFISYSHADETWAKWLHQRLERYRVPSRLIGRTGHHGTVPRRIGRCFRDQAELSAASHLSETLQGALRQSQALIIICSPRSAISHWVNEEIKFFRALGRTDFIYALIVEGEPNARDPAQECFPPALLQSEDGGRLHDPLAADARAGRDGKNDAFLKIASGLIGVGYDELRRREQRRRARLVIATIAASLSIAAMTSALAIAAYHARNEATLRRHQADDLINYMLGDLTVQLGSVNRLDILDGPTRKALEYLSQGTPDSLDDTSLTQRIDALNSLSNSQVLRFKIQDASHTSELAVAAARELLRRNPSSIDAKVELATSLTFRASTMVQSDELDAVASPISEGEALWASVIAAGSSKTSTRYRSALLDGLAGYASDRRKNDADALSKYKLCATAMRALMTESASTFKDFTESDVRDAYFECQEGVAKDAGHGGMIDESVDAYRALLSDAGSAFSKDPRLLNTMAQISGLAVHTYARAKRRDLAEPEANRAVDLARQLIAQDPANGQSKRLLAIALIGRCLVDRMGSRWPALERDAAEASATFAELLANNPTDDTTRGYLMRADDHLATSFEHLGRRDAAVAAWEQMAAQAKLGKSDVLKIDEATAHLEIWRALGGGKVGRAITERESASEPLSRLDDAKIARIDLHKLMFARMQFAYLDGDPARGDAIYREIRNSNQSPHDPKLFLDAVEVRREELCSMLKRGRGLQCER